jgi:hypothetical protein
MKGATCTPARARVPPSGSVHTHEMRPFPREAPTDPTHYLWRVGPRVSQLLSVAALLASLAFVALLLVVYSIDGRRPVPEETAVAIGWILFAVAAAFAVFLVALLAKRWIARASRR